MASNIISFYEKFLTEQQSLLLTNTPRQMIMARSVFGFMFIILAASTDICISGPIEDTYWITLNSTDLGDATTLIESLMIEHLVRHDHMIKK